MNNSFFVSQLELINLHISSFYSTFSNQTKNITFDQLIQYLSEFEVSTQELIRCIELASFAGSEDLIESYDIIEERYGFEQFISNDFPTPDCKGECVKIMSGKDDWSVSNLKYSLVYTFGYVSTHLLSYIVKNVINPKEQQSGLIYILNKIYEIITIKIATFPDAIVNIINLLANDIALLVAQISLSTNKLPNFKLLERTLHEITEMNVNLSPCLAFYFSQITYFSINNTQTDEKEKDEDFFTEVQNDEEFYDFFNFMCNLCIKYIENPVLLEYFSIILYNYFGQVFITFPEYTKNNNVKDLYKKLYNYIILKQKPIANPGDNNQISVNENLTLCTILQKAQSSKQLPYLNKLFVLLTSFLEEDYDFIFTLDEPLQYKIQELTILSRSKNYIQEFLHENHQIMQQWEYSHLNSNQFLEKSMNLIESNIDSFIQYQDYFYDFLIQISFSYPYIFAKVLNIIHEKKAINYTFFFNIMSYFLLHDDLNEAHKVAKKIAAQDQLDRYITSFSVRKEQSKIVYKYTSLIKQYFLETCNTSSVKIDKYKMYQLFINYKPSAKNAQGYVFSDIQSKLKAWNQNYHNQPSLFEFISTFETLKSQAENADASKQNSIQIYNLITYISSIYLSGVNEIVSFKLLTTLMVSCCYDVGNKALWGLEFILCCKSPRFLNDIQFVDSFINSILKRCTSNEFLSKTTLCLSASILNILLENVHTLSNDTLNNLEYFIFLCLCSSSFDTRKKCLELIKTTSNMCKLSMFYKKHYQEISQEGQYKTLYLFDFLKTNNDISINQMPALEFKIVANSKNIIIYMFYLGAFFKTLKKYEPEIVRKLEDRVIPMFISQFTPDTDPHFFMNMLIFIVYTDSLTQSLLQASFALVPKTSELSFAVALSNIQIKDQDLVFKTIGNNFPIGSLAGAVILYTLTHDQSFCDLQTEKMFTEGLRFYHDNFLNYYMNTKRIIPYEAVFSLKQDIFILNLEGNKNNDILLFALFVGSLKNIFAEIARKNNVPPKGKFGLCRSLNPSFSHFCNNKREFSFLFNLSSTANPITQKIAESALSQWIFFGKITEDESLLVSQKLSSEELSSNLLSRHFFTLLPTYTKEAINSSSKLYVICRQFSLAERDDSSDEKIYSLILSLFGDLIALGLVAIAFGENERRTLGYNLIACLCAGIYSQSHSKAETDAFIKGMEDFQPVLCGPYVDMDSVRSTSEYISKYFNSFSEMIFSAIFKFESSLTDKLSSKSPQDQNELNIKLSHIESLLNILNPWMEFGEFSNNQSFIKNCPKNMSCFTVYSFLYDLLSMRCAKPLSPSIAAVIAKMANSSPQNALATFCNLLHLFNKSKNNATMKRIVLSALSLVLTVSSQTLVPHLLSFTKVDSWFALHTQNVKYFYSFKTTIRAILEVITELILEGSDSIIAQGHIYLSFALIVYCKHPEQCDNLIKVITQTIQQVTMQNQSNNLKDHEKIAEQLNRGIIFGHRSEQIQEWYSKYTPKQMKEVKEMLLKWALSCGNLLISSVAFKLLCILNSVLTDKEKEIISYTLLRFSLSLHDFTLKYFNDSSNINLIINSHAQQKEKLYGIIIISSGLSLLRGSFNENLIKISCAFINFLEPDLLPIYNAAFLNIKGNFENLILPKSIDWFHIIKTFMTNINDASMYLSVRQILCICFTEDSIEWAEVHIPLIQFALSPYVWNARKDQLKNQAIFKKVKGTDLQELVDTPSDMALQDYYWHSSSDLTEEYISVIISYFSKLVKFGETNEIQAAFILLSELIEKNRIDPTMEGIQVALLSAVNCHDEILEDASSLFLKSAIKNGCSKITTIPKKPKSKVFPKIVLTTEIPTKEWMYEENCFSDIEKLPPLLVRDSDFDYSELIGKDPKIEPFSSWVSLFSSQQNARL